MTKTWTIPELLQLQREYELLQMSIDTIALKHGRSAQGILCRLKSEGFISSEEFIAINTLANKFTTQKKPLAQRYNLRSRKN